MGEGVKQGFCRFQVGRLEPFAEPAVDGIQQRRRIGRTSSASAALPARRCTLLTLSERSFTLRGVFLSFGPRTMTPSDAAWQQLISTLHASGRKAALAITGGGSGAVGELLRVPGGSRLLIEAQIPYDERALATFLGSAPAQACSADTAIAMAQSARARAARLAPVGADLVGLGATAALVSDRPRRGEHRFHIAFANAAGIAHCTCVLAKGRRDRAAEEDLVSRAIVLWLARACGIAAPSPRRLIDADEHYAETVAAAGAAVDTIDQLLAGELDRVTVQPDGQMILSAPQPLVLFPGSFNPMHEGHVLLARVAEELRQQPLAFEISVTNVDKPPLAGETVRRRLSQFAWKSPVELTRAPTFVEKSRLFPSTTFVIGADTAERLVAPKYYGDDEFRMHVALEEIANSGSSFLVAVRLDAAGRVRALNDIPVPRRYADLFTEIPEHRFRHDISSSELRARRRAQGEV
jgi:nicotinic acid mononucleotide adenylyltransferase